MLQRAASNAYSWWMASHIRTKQSKWMEQNLLDMEEKVSAVLKLIEEDGDSFIQKANMYYKKRPEIINFVEEFFRAYRALADRYDHLSTDLQNANNTIASICPDQVRGLDDDDDDFDFAPPRVQKMPSDNTDKVPKVPKLPVKELKFIANTKKKMQEKKAPKSTAHSVAKSGLTKEEGIGEIDRIQKRILALQTEKEFVKSSYESRLAKYREVENEIKEEQQKVNSLQDEFGEGKVIEDDVARNLMAATAFRSCKETLEKLKQIYERSTVEVEVEQKRITVARGRVDALKKVFLSSESVAEVTKIAQERAKKRKANVDNISNKPKVDTESEAGNGDSEADLADKVDVLVNMVTNLETTTSSQEALIQRLKSDNDELQGLIQSFEEGKANLVDGNRDLKMKMIQLELKWQGVQDLNHSIENQKSNLQSGFNDADSNLDELSQNIMPVENLETLKSSPVVLSKNETDKTKEKPKAKAGKEFLKPKAGKEFLKPKAGKEFLNPKVTTSPAEAESEKGSEEHVATNNAHASKELYSAPVSANANASKELYSAPVSANADASKELNSVAKSAVDGAGASKELNSVPKSANDGVADTSKELHSVPKSANDGVVDTLKELHSVPKSANDGVVDTLKELHSVPKSANDGVTDASKELHSIPKSANDGVTDASKELHSIPKSANEGDGSPRVSETSDHLIAMAKVVGQASSLIANKVSKSDSKEHELAALSLTLEETKKKLMEVETNHQNELFEITLQLKELKNLNDKKDELIRSLRMKLSQGRPNDEGTDEFLESSEKLQEPKTETTEAPQPVEKEERDWLPKPVNEPEPTSAIEEKFRTDIDELLEENLDFWYRFSSTLCEIQKYQTGVKDLEAEVLKLEERQKSEGSSTSKYSAKSDVRPLYKHLREMQTELSLWIEKSMSLKEELKSRSASLCEIQEEITKALKASAEDEEFRFTSFQAAKFQGEILNMKQENNRVGDELQAGLEMATSLQRDAERALTKLSNDWGLSGSRNRQGGPAEVRSNVPLRSFIFGVKKKPRSSIFSVVQPALQRKQNKPGTSSCMVRL
ncbi:hypothetical protein V6N13_024259 [Hibiscus sabdariffa]|uniref:NAB domain-containing protein n=1 Tax=Hibiscus sabdariffa TaxID=183260 RepID=A0ABR2BX52_9ROSI